MRPPSLRKGPLPVSESTSEAVSDDAERRVIGRMLRNTDAITDTVEELTIVDFHSAAKATVYTAILDLYARDEPTAPIAVATELTTRGQCEAIGGVGRTVSCGSSASGHSPTTRPPWSRCTSEPAAKRRRSTSAAPAAHGPTA
ncbi:DnaB-like helicase N-terminal domain-containing protein [Streptomyces flavidovirens]|uniref:DnaB-like helicase N-terminal domain-containing protein n=1 Tax=Streptomyces flavidovirens TaxID=67298 RepID=A0ABW6RNU7_9ACTN